MDQFDIYVNVERPSGNPRKKRTLGKCSDNIYANEDKIHTLEQKRPEPALSGNEHKRVHTVDCIFYITPHTNILLYILKELV